MWNRLTIRARIYGIFAVTLAFMAGSTLYVFFAVLAIGKMTGTEHLTKDGQGIERIAEQRLLTALIGLSVIASILAAWMAGVLRSRIMRPLAAITNALSELARGKTDLPVPEVSRPDEIGEMARAFEVFRRNTVALEVAHRVADEAQMRATALARHDSLTGLPNRRVLSEDIEKAIARAKRGAAAYEVLLIDLDRFKLVNDLHGHAAGDSVLCEVAERIKAIVRKGDTFARVGGDEFAIISECGPGTGSSPDAAIHLANRVIAAVQEPFAIGNFTVEIGATIGIAQCPADGTDAETLLHAADMAMYRSKREGRGAFRFFERTMDIELRARAALEKDLRDAVATGAIEPHYQPLIELSSDRILGFEVLARWHHPQHGSILPDVFIPLAEELGLISDLTFALLRTACREARGWPADVFISVNLSPLQLKDRLLPVKVLAILSETGFPAGRLEVEITENALVSDLDAAKAILASFQNVGIKVALDDFGTGYSSMYHLRELRFDKIKVDRSFIQSMRNNPESARVVGAILGLTRSLGLPTIAEGIEDAEMARRLAESGCEMGQGFHYGKATRAAEAIALIRDRAMLDRTVAAAS